MKGFPLEFGIGVRGPKCLNDGPTRCRWSKNFSDRFSRFDTIPAVTDSHPATQPATQPPSHVAVAITLNAKASNLKTRRMYWRRASFKTVKRSQAPGDAAVLKLFFRHNFVIFRRRLKRIAFFWNQWIFVHVSYMQNFNFRDGHVTTFRYPSGVYNWQMPGHRLSRLAKGTPSESPLSMSTIFWG